MAAADALVLLASSMDDVVPAAPSEIDFGEPGALRCLDPTHPAACASCACAPEFGEEAQFELFGDPGRKNGEKLLKSLLSRTGEWRSKAVRLRTAEECEEKGRATLGRLMRGLDTSASLRKQDMLFLARVWGYRSNLWRPRRSRRRGEEALELEPARAAPAPPPAPPLAASFIARVLVAPTPQAAPQPPPPAPPALFALSVAGLPPLPLVFLSPPPPLLKALLAAHSGGLTATLYSPDAHAVMPLPDMAMASVGRAAPAG